MALPENINTLEKAKFLEFNGLPVVMSYVVNQTGDAGAGSIPNFGLVNIPNGQDFLEITFQYEMQDDTYSHVIGIKVSDPNPSILNYLVYKQTTAGLKIKFNAAADSDNYYLSYVIVGQKALGPTDYITQGAADYRYYTKSQVDLLLDAIKDGYDFTGAISASNLSGTNTGDETLTTILAKLGYTPANKSGDTFSGNITAPNFNNPSKNIWLFEDFGKNLSSLGLDWSNSPVNGGSVGTATSSNPFAFPVGGVLMNTNTSTNGGITLLNWYHFVGMGKITLECGLRIMSLDVGTTDKCYTYFGSCAVQGTYNFNTGFSIGYNSGISTNFIAQTMKTNVDNTTISSIPVVADTPYRLKVEITNLTSVNYYVNDVLIATHTTNFHDGLTVAFACIKTRQAGTAITNRIVIVDYVSLAYALNSQR